MIYFYRTIRHVAPSLGNGWSSGSNFIFRGNSCNRFRYLFIRLMTCFSWVFKMCFKKTFLPSATANCNTKLTCFEYIWAVNFHSFKSKTLCLATLYDNTSGTWCLLAMTLFSTELYTENNSLVILLTKLPKLTVTGWGSSSTSFP